MRMTHSQLIDALGGTASVAGAMQLSMPTVSNWRKRGVSWPHRMRIANMARKMRVGLPDGFLA